MLEHIKAYFDRFGTKPCCFEDLQPYINAVMGDVDTTAGFINELRIFVHLDAEGVCKPSWLRVYEQLAQSTYAQRSNPLSMAGRG